MTAYKILRNLKYVDSRKEFMEIYLLRQIWVDNVLLTDPKQEFENVKKIKIGIKEITI